MRKIKLTISIITLFFSFIFTNEQNTKFTNKIKKQPREIKKIFDNIEKLPIELQLHIISYVISKPQTIDKAIKYLKAIRKKNKQLKKLVDDKTDYIIKELIKNFKITEKRAVIELGTKSSIKWLMSEIEKKRAKKTTRGELSIKINEQLSNIENLPIELQLHIILYIISKPTTIQEAVKYLRNVALSNKNFDNFISEDIEEIIKQLAKNFGVPRAHAAAIITVNGFLKWLKNYPPSLLFILFLIIELKTIEISKKYLKAISKVNEKFEKFIGKNIEHVITEFAQHFNVSEAYTAALLDTKESLNWLKNQISKEDDISKYISKNTINQSQKNILSNAFSKILHL